MDTNTQIERLIELAIVQRTELKRLVEELPQLKEHLSAEIERTFEETEPQLRAELEEWTSKQAADKTAALGVALESKIASLAKSLEESAQAKFSAVLAARDQNADLLKQAEERIAVAASEIPGKVKEIVTAELARFPRAGEIDRLRKEFQEPRGLNPRGKWLPDQTYNKLDLVTWNGDSYVSNTDDNKERPGRNAANWTLSAARGTSGGGPADLSALTAVPSNGTLLIGSGTSWVNGQLTAGAGVSITVGPGAITISATDGDITLDDGTAASPSLHFTNDPDTGIYRPAANTLGISTSGVQRMYVDENGITTVGAGGTFDGSVHAANGNANNPSLSFTSDQDTGFFRHQPNEIGVALGSTQYATLTSTTFSITPNLVVSGTGTINGTSIPASKTLVVTTDKISALAATTSSELAGKITDETGTGSLVFANTPTLVTPNIGAATGTSLTVTGNVTASDAILGTSGPSVKSTLSARAPRQGLVFDGTAGATTSIPAFGTGDWTIAFWANPTSFPNSFNQVTGGSSGPVPYFNASGTLGVGQDGVSAGSTSFGASATAGKMDFWSIVTASGVTTAYKNGVATGSQTLGLNFTGTIIKIGSANNGTSSTFYGLLSVLIYNRALSASEVVALYEAGAPSGADYPATAAGTSLSTSAFSGTRWGSSFTTFSGASATGFTAARASGGGDDSVTSDSFTVKKGDIIRCVFDMTNSGDLPYIYLGEATTGAALSGLSVTTAGTAQVFNLTVTTAGSARVAFYTANAQTANYTIANFTARPLGLLLAPDAAQAGGGLVWYDTSGNAANITLPASGVSWNVPSSRYLGGNWTTSGNLTVSGTGNNIFNSGGGNLLIGTTSDGGQKLQVAGTVAKTAAGPTTIAIASNEASNLRDEGRLFIVGNASASSRYLGLEYYDVGNGAYRNVAAVPNGGNLLVGTSTDGGQKLQVSGTSNFSNPGSSTIANFTNSANADFQIVLTASTSAKIGPSTPTSLILQTNSTTALTLSGSDQSATFAGNVGSNAAFRTLAASSFPGAVSTNGFSYYFGSSAGGAVIYGKGSISDVTLANKDGSDVITIPTGTTNAKFTGSIAIGNTVQTAVAVASTHKVTISIGGTTYYLLATNV